MKTKAKAAMAPLPQAEFEALPSSVQRKCFSSLERLQIQQQHAAADPTSARSSHTSTTSTPFHPPVTLSTTIRRHKSAKLVSKHAAAAASASAADVDFFFALPEKLRKQHFSREEQLFFHARQYQNASLLADEHEHERAQQRFDDFCFDFPHPLESNPVTPPATPTTTPRRRFSSASSTRRKRSPLLPNKQDKQDKQPRHRHHHRISSLPHFDMLSTPVFAPKDSPPCRRTMSLTAASHRPSASPSPFVADPLPNSIGPNLRHQRARSSTLSLSLSGRRSSQTPTPPLFDPEATHYQDPEARKKLRMYLASPQKFDEAIEFGFPSTPDNDSQGPHFQLPRIDNHARKFSRDMHTFLRDGKLSFLEDNASPINQGLADSDSDSTADDTESPSTPSSTGLSFHMQSSQASHRNLSMESPRASPAPSAGTAAAAGQFNREMTLRMTLTRPDLRANEDHLYGWQALPSSAAPKPAQAQALASQPDPLALEDLVFTDDATGSHGAFYVKPKPRGNLVSRILKRASLRTKA